MYVVPFDILISRIKSGKATIPEFTTLFHHLRNPEFSDREKLSVCRTLAQRQYAYAIAGDSHLKSWVSNIETALEEVDLNISRNISSILRGHPQNEKSASIPNHSEPDSLTIALYEIFFGHAPNPPREPRPEDKKTILLLMILKSNLGLFLGVSLVSMTIACLIWISSVQADINSKLCSENSTSVHGSNFLSLSDGSEIILNAGGTICYVQPFYNNGRREVGLLEGSAYFEIERDAEHPFFIKTPGGVTAEIRGTGLNISVDKVQQIVSIAVAHGIVIVHYNGEITEVPPGQQMSIATLNHETRMKVFDPSNVIWPYPGINLENVPLETVAKQIEDRFHVSVIFKYDVLKRERITTSFGSRDFQLKHIVETLNIALNSANVDFKLTGNTIIVNKKDAYEEVPDTPLP